MPGETRTTVRSRRLVPAWASVAGTVLLGACAAPEWPPALDSSAFFLTVERTADDTLVMAFPACPGEEVEFGIAKDQDPDREISYVAHQDTVTGSEAQLIEFTISPETLLRGSLNSDMAVVPGLGKYAGTLGSVEEFGGVYVVTELGVEGFGLEEGVPPVGQSWIYTIDGVEVLDGDLDSSTRVRLTSIVCSR